jgi:hypothetical protein
LMSGTGNCMIFIYAGNGRDLSLAYRQIEKYPDEGEIRPANNCPVTGSGRFL